MVKVGAFLGMIFLVGLNGAQAIARACGDEVSVANAAADHPYIGGLTPYQEREEIIAALGNRSSCAYLTEAEGGTRCSTYTSAYFYARLYNLNLKLDDRR